MKFISAGVINFQLLITLKKFKKIHFPRVCYVVFVEVCQYNLVILMRISPIKQQLALMSNANLKCVRRRNFGQFYGARSRFYDIRAHRGPEKFTLSPFSGSQCCVTFKQREPLLLWSFLGVFAALLPWMCASVYVCVGRKGTRVCQWQPVPADFSPGAAGALSTRHYHHEKQHKIY